VVCGGGDKGSVHRGDWVDAGGCAAMASAALASLRTGPLGIGVGALGRRLRSPLIESAPRGSSDPRLAPSARPRSSRVVGRQPAAGSYDPFGAQEGEAKEGTTLNGSSTKACEEEKSDKLASRL
jgi:hypothetical protein